MDEQIIKAEESTQKRKKADKKFVLICVIEAVVLIAILAVCRIIVFPPMAKLGEMHTRIALECVGVAFVVFVISIMAISAKKAWKTYGKYIVCPIEFLLFAFCMMAIVNEINFG